MARSHADLDDAADEAGHEWSRSDLTVAEKEAELGGGSASGDITEHESEGSVEETIKNDPDLEPGPGAVQSTTEETPSRADETSAPGPYTGDDAPKVDDPPVRTTDPDQPIAQTLAAGAGEHTPPDPDVFDKEGRRKGAL